MIKTLSFFLLLLSASAVSAQRLCNSPYCAMCNALERQALASRQYIPTLSTAPAMEPTPDAAINVMLRELSLTKDDVLYDLGCGDGRVLIAAVKRYGCKAVGIEINPTTAERARYRVRMAQTSSEIVPNRIRIVTGDVTKFKLNGATAVTMYLYPDTVEQLVPKLIGKRVASFNHDLPGLQSRKIAVDRYTVYVSESFKVSQSEWPGWSYLN